MLHSKVAKSYSETYGTINMLHNMVAKSYSETYGTIKSYIARWLIRTAKPTELL